MCSSIGAHSAATRSVRCSSSSRFDAETERYRRSGQPALATHKRPGELVGVLRHRGEHGVAQSPAVGVNATAGLKSRALPTQLVRGKRGRDRPYVQRKVKLAGGAQQRSGTESPVFTGLLNRSPRSAGSPAVAGGPVLLLTLVVPTLRPTRDAAVYPALNPPAALGAVQTLITQTEPSGESERNAPESVVGPSRFNRGRGSTFSKAFYRSKFSR